MLAICVSGSAISASAETCKQHNVKSSITQESSSLSCCYKFYPVIIDDEIINPPKNINEVDQFLDKIKITIVNKKGNTAIFKYGEHLNVKLQLPFLGIGVNGMVFTIVEDKKPATKVLKLNILNGKQGLETAKKEVENYPFWYKLSKNKSFSVACLHDYDPMGLYHIKEKNNGIPLTNFLVSKQLIFKYKPEDSLIDFTEVNNMQKQDKQIEEVAVVIQELLDTIKLYPKNNIGISPNNIFVEFADNTECIKKIELIEYDISRSIKQVNHKMENFIEYLHFSQYKLQSYIERNIGKY